MLPLTTNLCEAYKHGRDDEQNFIQNLALFLVTILKEHGFKLYEADNVKETLMDALHYLILISEVEETEIFKICLDYWNILAAELYRETPNTGMGSSPLLLMGGLMRQPEMPPRRAMYNAILSKVSS